MSNWVRAFIGCLAVVFRLPKSWVAREGPMAVAINWAGLLLMATPYVIGGSIGAWIFYCQRRAGKTRTILEGLGH